MSEEKIVIDLLSSLGKLIRSSIYCFFNNSEDDNDGWKSIINTITNIVITKEKAHYVIIITTYRPGLIIGKGGKTFQELSDKLGELFSIFEGYNMTYEIQIKECTLWNKLY